MRTAEEYLDAFHSDIGINTKMSLSRDMLLNEKRIQIGTFQDDGFIGVMVTSDLKWMKCHIKAMYVLASVYDDMLHYEMLSAMRTFYKGL